MSPSIFTPTDYLERLEKARKKMREKNIDLLIVYSDAWRNGNCRYLTGIKPYPGFFSDIPGYNQAMIFIPADDDAILFWCDLTLEWAKRGMCGTIAEEPWMEIKPWTDMYSMLTEMIQKEKIKNIGFEGKDFVPWNVYNEIKQTVGEKLQDVDILKNLRRIKEEKEIKLLEVASNINDKICEELVNGVIRYGVTEKEVERAIEELGHAMGAEYVDANFMQSRNVGWGHAIDEPIRDGSILSLHVILQYEGYCSDNDRIMGFGKITQKEKELAEIVKNGLDNFLKAIKPGVEAMDAIIAAVDTHEYIAEGEQGAGVHGHGIGLEGEEELINEWVFEKGMVFTASVGAYNKEIKTTWATEDVVVVTSNGVRRLTNFPIDYVISR